MNMSGEKIEVLVEGSEQVLRVDANSWSYSPSIEDSALVMGYVIDKLVEIPGVSRIVFNQRRNFIYEYDQVKILVEIAQIYGHLVKGKKIFSLIGYDEGSGRFFGEKIGILQYLIYNLLRNDPIGCYVEVKRLVREERIRLEKEGDLRLIDARKEYIALLSYIFNLLDRARIISLVKEELDGYKVGERGLYKNLFRAVITPDFIFTRIMSSPPLDGEEIEAYSFGKSDVVIYKLPGEIKLLYHLNVPEFKLDEDEYMLVELARNVLAEHKPREEEFLDPSRMRDTIYNIGRDLLNELAENKGIQLAYKRVEELAEILVRYTVGFGVIEILLQDEKVQDLNINAPIGQTNIFIVHQDYGECVTNIIPSREDGEGWATKFRLLSGRPLDEANPILDTELSVSGGRSRVAVIMNPLSPNGLAFAFRRHRDKPWTLPLFIENRMLTPLAAGLISFLVDGGRSIIFSGTRSSGKTSLMQAMMLEIMRKYRILTVEDTLEISQEYFRKLGYNILPMKVRSALMSGGTELAAEEGIRTSLRMGDSSLIVGEVRSNEARAMFEAMRVGALANVVAGTIHGASPYAVFDRVVNDLGVPRTSFKAVDVIVISNPVRSADGLRSFRRVLQISEVRKHWEEDPLREKGFIDLMNYDSKLDLLKETDDLKNGESDVLKEIAGNVREWAGNWDGVWENILLRARIKESLVNFARKSGNKFLLEADFVVKSNDLFHRISEKIMEEVGYLDSKMIYRDWEDWCKREIKEKKI